MTARDPRRTDEAPDGPLPWGVASLVVALVAVLGQGLIEPRGGEWFGRVEIGGIVVIALIWLHYALTQMKP